MNREQAKALLPIIQAFSEGKTIQSRCITDEMPLWWDDNNPTFKIDDFDYQIKPEPRYRPFKNAEECWAEMLKHTPFGWVESLKSNAMYEIQCLKKGGGGKIYSYDDIFFSNFEEFFKDYKFADGTPFGSLEEDYSTEHLKRE